MQPSRRQTLGCLAVGLEDIKLLIEKLLCIKLKTILSSKLKKTGVVWVQAYCGILMKKDNQYKKIDSPMTEVGSRDIHDNTDSELTLCPEKSVHICRCENR